MLFALQFDFGLPVILVEEFGHGRKPAGEGRHPREDRVDELGGLLRRVATEELEFEAHRLRAGMDILEVGFQGSGQIIPVASDLGVQLDDLIADQPEGSEESGVLGLDRVPGLGGGIESVGIRTFHGSVHPLDQGANILEDVLDTGPVGLPSHAPRFRHGQVPAESAPGMHAVRQIPFEGLEVD